ncbi:hypothetical protein D558_1555 [Bordetella holmesii 44057]|nr:hypothetical protein D560_1564 [Bordetella holmesii ATCC 51541]AIT26227.1 hypothetical protein D558_1555 [Bordetella holmesii 44057]
MRHEAFLLHLFVQRLLVLTHVALPVGGVLGAAGSTTGASVATAGSLWRMGELGAWRQVMRPDGRPPWWPGARCCVRHRLRPH